MLEFSATIHFLCIFDLTGVLSSKLRVFSSSACYFSMLFPEYADDLDKSAVL